MGLFDGKRGLVFGIANDHSIAWAITQRLHAEGAEMGFTHLPDKDPERPRMERRLRKLVEPLGAPIIESCDVTNDEDLDRVFGIAAETFGEIDFVLHSVAYAPLDDLKGEVVNVSRDGFKLEALPDGDLHGLVTGHIRDAGQCRECAAEACGSIRGEV